MARPAYDPRLSLVLQVPAAEPVDAESHFLSKLSYETDPSDVKTDLDKGVKGFVLVDCRTEEKFATGHVPGAVSFPYRTMTEETVTRLPKDKTIVLYCTSVHCNASTKAALRLTTLGFKVKEMLGGIEGWKAEGYAVEVGNSTANKVTTKATA